MDQENVSALLIFQFGRGLYVNVSRFKTKSDDPHRMVGPRKYLLPFDVVSEAFPDKIDG